MKIYSKHTLQIEKRNYKAFINVLLCETIYIFILGGSTNFCGNTFINYD